LPTIFPSRVLVLSSDESYLATIRQEYLGTPQCQRSPQTGQPGSNQTSQSIFVSSHFHSKKLPVTLCYGAFWNENAYFVYANSVAGSIRPFVAGFQVTGDNMTKVFEQMQSSKKPERVRWTNKSIAKIIARNQDALKKQIDIERQELCMIFLDAIDAQDSKKIFEIGRAIDSHKAGCSGDRNRAAILTWKWLLDARGEKMTIRELAQIIGWRDMKSADGFSQLRRLCRELKFPIAPSKRQRKISRKLA
jgi:hypothetical protein